jgi:hypothetical protein
MGAIMIRHDFATVHSYPSRVREQGHGFRLVDVTQGSLTDPDDDTFTTSRLWSGEEASFVSE